MPACRRRWPPWCSGSPWCWSTSTPCPGAANRLLGRFARASAVGGTGPAAPCGGHRDPGAAGDRRRPAGPGDRPPARRRSACPWTGPWWRCSVARSVRGGSTRPWGSGRPLEGARRRAIYHIVGRRDWDGRTGDRAGPGRDARPGWSSCRVPFEERMAAGVRRGRRRGVPGRGDDRGRAGRGRGAVGAGAAARGARGTTRRPTPGCWSGRVPRCCWPTPSATRPRSARSLDGLLGRPGRARCHGRGRRVDGPARRRRRRGPGGRGQRPTRRRRGAPRDRRRRGPPPGSATPGRSLTVHMVGIGGAGMSAIATVLTPWATR